MSELSDILLLKVGVGNALHSFVAMADVKSDNNVFLYLDYFGIILRQNTSSLNANSICSFQLVYTRFNLITKNTLQHRYITCVHQYFPN